MNSQAAAVNHRLGGISEELHKGGIVTAVDGLAVADHASQAREFLDRAWGYLAEGDLHQASEKGWGAAAHMAKAVAQAQGWEYSRHDEFGVVLSDAWLATRDDRIRQAANAPHELHRNYYRRKRHLRAGWIEDHLLDVAGLLDALAPLARGDAEDAGREDVSR